MSDKAQILAISGSTRNASSNHNLIKAISSLSHDIFTVQLFNGLADIPHFNPDLDNDDPPHQVVAFRRMLKEADAVLISTPEYAIGVPGTLKNAVDWTVSSMEFSGKPVALITASSSGASAHQSLLGTLLIIESLITNETQLLIPFIRTKISTDGTITDSATLNSINTLIHSLFQLIIDKRSGSVTPSLLAHAGINSGKI